MLDRLARRYGTRPSALLEGIGPMEALVLDLACALDGAVQDRRDYEAELERAKRG